MIHSVNSLSGFSIRATDGEIGSVNDVYFDDQQWVARYLVIETGGFFSRRKLLVSPYAVVRIDWIERHIDVSLTREQVKSSPDIDTDRPVSRQQEMTFLAYYGFPLYWGGPLLWGERAYPAVSMAAASREDAAARELREREQQERATADEHLRSAREVIGYTAQAIDGAIGHIDDFLLDEQSWAIDYAVVDTRDFWPGKHSVLPREWIERVEWAERKVYLTSKRAAVKEGPDYDAAAPMSESELRTRFMQRGR